MCKHKSGGMSKPSGATSQGGGISERSTASISSHSFPQDSSTTSSSQVPTPAPSSNSTDNVYGSQIRSFSSVPVHPSSETASCNDSCDTHTSFLTNPENSACVLKQNFNISFIPNIQESCLHPYLETPESDEDDTEQSPMLMNEACGIYCQPVESWNTNVLSDPEFKDIHKSKQFSMCDQYSCIDMQQRDDAINCDNFPIYHKLDLQNALQKPVSYIPLPYHSAGAMAGSNYFDSSRNKFDEHEFSEFNRYNYTTKMKKKWFLNQKCKSADSEPDPHGSCITSLSKHCMPPDNSYIQEQNTSISNTFIEGYHSYLKPTYSSNTDPVAGPSGLQRPSSINWEMGLNNHDNEFRSRSYSLTPTINFAVFESESSSEAEDVPEPIITEAVDIPVSNDLSVKTIDDPFEMSMLSLGKAIPISPSAAQLSIASSYGDNGSPICKICHMTARENDPLISPCRCSGTMQYIHCGCLMRWLEVCHKRGRRPASCELCQYQYHWHKKFKIRHWQMPQCSRKDKILHLLFFLAVLLMITCASITVLCFKQDKGTKMDPDRTELTQSEIVTLICGVLFFFAFFVAMYVEVKSHDTLYQLLVKFIHINQQWYIDEYEKKETAPVAV